MNMKINQAKAELAKGKISSEELVRQLFARIEQYKELNSYIILDKESAISKAKAADERIKSGKARFLEGIPVAIKDVFCTKDIRTTACSHILDGFVPTYESTVTQKLQDAGAIFLGKTNMDEFAMGSANTNSYYGAVINPWKRKNDDTKLVPGGSSGGSAAAVAADLCFAALGSDTGGSVRQPAAFCGIVGVKPTYGRCSRWGMIAFASSLDQAGVFAKNTEDAATILQTICGFDPKDSTSEDLPPVDFLSSLKKDVAGLKIGIPQEYVSDLMAKEVAELWDEGKKWLQKAGATIIDISLPHTKYALPVYYIIAPAEASSNLARYDGVRYGLRIEEKNDSLDQMYSKTRQAGFGAEVKRRIMIGTYVLSAGYYDAYYKKAQRVRTLIANDFHNAFQKVDAILTPTTPTAAFAIGENLDPLTMYLNDVFTVPSSLAGIPGISVPVGLSNQGLPLGLQILSKAYDEDTMFRVAAAIENAAGFNHKPSI